MFSTVDILTSRRPPQASRHCVSWKPNSAGTLAANGGRDASALRRGSSGPAQDEPSNTAGHRGREPSDLCVDDLLLGAPVPGADFGAKVAERLNDSRHSSREVFVVQSVAGRGQGLLCEAPDRRSRRLLHTGSRQHQFAGGLHQLLGRTDGRLVSLAVEGGSQTNQGYLDGSSLRLGEFEPAQPREYDAHDLVGYGLTALTAHTVCLGAAGVRDGVVAYPREFVLRSQASRRQRPRVAAPQRAVDDMTIIDQLAHPLNNHLVERACQAGGLCDAEEVGPVGDVGEVAVTDVVIERDEKVQIVRHLVHDRMVPEGSDERLRWRRPA